MFVIIAYDVNTISPTGAKRLRHMAKACVNYGQRVQNSVFEMNIEYGTFLKLKDQLVGIMDENTDSLRFYYLGNNWKNKVEHIGAKASYDTEGVLLF